MEYYLDFSTIEKAGIKNWFDHFFYPYDWLQFLKIEREIKNIYNEFIGKQNDSLIKDSMVVNYHSHILFTGILYIYKIKCELERKGHVLKIGKGYDFLDALINSKSGVIKYNFISPIKNISLISLFKKNIGFQIKSENYSLLNRMYIGDTALNTTVQYLNETKKSNVLWKPSSNFLQCPPIGYKAGSESTFADYIFTLYDQLNSLLINYDIQVDNKLYDEIIQQISKSFITCLRYYTYNIKVLNYNKLPKEYFIGSNNSFSLRLFTALLRYYSNKVIGFDHGNPLWFEYDLVSWLELSLDDTFVTESTNSTKSLDKITHNYPPPNRNQCSIVSFSSQRSGILDRYRQIEIKSVKNILLVAPPFQREHSPYSVYIPNIVHLYLTIDVITKLYKQGYNVLYQKHPGGLYSNLIYRLLPGVKISEIPFEQHFFKYDLLIFFHLRTTTIKSALLSNVPIVYLNGSWEPNLESDMLLNFQKRCEVIDLTYDDRYTLTLETRKIKPAILSAQEKAVDTTLIATYFT